jgi:hypothetical protein
MSLTLNSSPSRATRCCCRASLWLVTVPLTIFAGRPLTTPLCSLRYLDTFVKTDRVQLLLANVVDRLFGKGCLMEKVNR